MKVFTCSNFEIHDYFGVVLVVVAPDVTTATALAREELRVQGLLNADADMGSVEYTNYKKVNEDCMVEIPMTLAAVTVLSNNYV